MAESSNDSAIVDDQDDVGIAYRSEASTIVRFAMIVSRPKGQLAPNVRI